MADKVRRDLNEFCLIISEDKCAWEVTQELEWMGWRINTKEFTIYVPGRKVVKLEKKLDELLLKLGKKVKLRELSLVVGLIISLGLAVGKSAGVYARFFTIKVAKVAEGRGWEAWLVLSVEVLEELRYWRVNLRRLNWIRKKAGVQVVWFKRLYSDAGGCMRVDKKVCEDTVGLQDC